METITAVALTLGLVEVVKFTGIPRRVLPLIALAVGVCVAYLLADFAVSSAVIADGLVAGLSAMGFWTGARVVTNHG